MRIRLLTVLAMTLLSAPAIASALDRALARLEEASPDREHGTFRR